MKYGNIKSGLTGECRVTVTKEMTARHLGSGNVNVFATPEDVSEFRERVAQKQV